MVEKIRTTRYEIRSHGHKTVLSEDGIVMGKFCLHEVGYNDIDSVILKRLMRHLGDVIKCMDKIKKDRARKK